MLMVTDDHGHPRIMITVAILIRILINHPLSSPLTDHNLSHHQSSLITDHHHQDLGHNGQSAVLLGLTDHNHIHHQSLLITDEQIQDLGHKYQLFARHTLTLPVHEPLTNWPGLLTSQRSNGDGATIREEHFSRAASQADRAGVSLRDEEGS